MVRIFTLYATGLTELRGHGANWHQGGPQWVRNLPAKVGDAGILVIRRFPNDPQRKQRLPCIVSRRRLEAALKQLCKPVDEGGHRANEKGAWPNGGIRVSEANLAEYDDEAKHTRDDLWEGGTLGFVVHTPGQWISIVPPTEQMRGIVVRLAVLRSWRPDCQGAA